jgi:hypothetical protein
MTMNRDLKISVGDLAGKPAVGGTGFVLIQPPYYGNYHYADRDTQFVELAEGVGIHILTYGGKDYRNNDELLPWKVERIEILGLPSDLSLELEIMRG